MCKDKMCSSLAYSGMFLLRLSESDVCFVLVCLVLEDEISHGTSRVDRGGVLGEKDDSLTLSKNFQSGHSAPDIS